MGYEMMQFDMEVAREISERITEQHNTANGKSNANNAVARRNQKRQIDLLTKKAELIKNAIKEIRKQ